MSIEYHPQDAGAAFKWKGSITEGDVGMSVGLVSVGGEEGYGGFGCRDGQPPLRSPLRHSFRVCGEGAGSCWNVGIGKGVIKIIGVGRGKFGGLGVGGYKEVEKDWGDTGALRDSCTGVSIGGRGVCVAAAGHPPTEIG